MSRKRAGLLFIAARNREPANETALSRHKSHSPSRDRATSIAVQLYLHIKGKPGRLCCPHAVAADARAEAVTGTRGITHT
jgi:hypothetical protein